MYGGTYNHPYRHILALQQNIDLGPAFLCSDSSTVSNEKISPAHTSSWNCGFVGVAPCLLKQFLSSFYFSCSFGLHIFSPHYGPVSPGSFKQLLEFWACANCQCFLIVTENSLLVCFWNFVLVQLWWGILSQLIQAVVRILVVCKISSSLG